MKKIEFVIYNLLVIIIVLLIGYGAGMLFLFSDLISSSDPSSISWLMSHNPSNLSFTLLGIALVMTILFLILFYKKIKDLRSGLE
jgi:hypothetical protein